jgi:hypothetical protein
VRESRAVQNTLRLALPAVLLGTSLFAPTSAVASGFIGSGSCRVCHQAAYEQWRASPHARALDSLPPQDQKDSRCLQCHAKDVAQGGDAGVTCETCHGAGHYYWPRYVMRDAELAKAAGLVAAPDARACVLCHDAATPSMRPFDPTAAMQAIDHWSKERAARAVKTGARCPRGSARPDRFAMESGQPADTFLGRALTAERRHSGQRAVAAPGHSKALAALKASKARPD